MPLPSTAPIVNADPSVQQVIDEIYREWPSPTPWLPLPFITGHGVTWADAAAADPSIPTAVYRVVPGRVELRGIVTNTAGTFGFNALSGAMFQLPAGARPFKNCHPKIMGTSGGYWFGRLVVIGDNNPTAVLAGSSAGYCVLWGNPLVSSGGLTGAAGSAVFLDGVSIPLGDS